MIRNGNRMATIDDAVDNSNDHLNELLEAPEKVVDATGVVEQPTFTFKSIKSMEKRLKATEKVFEQYQELPAAIEDVLYELSSHLDRKLAHKGTFVRVGSSKDGTHSVKLSEMDYLFVFQKNDINIFRNKAGYKIVDADTDEDISPKHLNEQFRDATDELFLTDIKLPNGLRHAGFAHPGYSGVRRNGPATTLLFTWLERILVSIHVILALPLPFDIDADIREIVNEKLGPIREDNPETTFEVNRQVHLVPVTPGEKKWELTTCKLEADLLNQLHERAPVKRIISLQKVIVDECQKRLRGTVEKFTELEVKPEATKSLVDILRRYEQSNRNEGLRKDIMKTMRYDNIYLPLEEAEHFQELSEPTTSIRSSAIKHLTISKGSDLPGSFSPTAKPKVLNDLIEKVFEDLADDSCHEVPHYFFSMPVAMMTAFDLSNRAQSADAAQNQCRQIAANFQRRTLQPQAAFAQRRGINEPDVEPDDLVLHDYQAELVMRVMEGKNVIIVSPPGADEGHTAMKIAEINLDKTVTGPKNKIAHICISHRQINERWKQYKKCLNSYASIGIHAYLNDDKAPFEEIVRENDIVVTTPQYLCDQLRFGNLSCLGEFSHLFVDHCHAAKGNSPYVALFTYYLNRKMKNDQDYILPQVIGFTSFIGEGSPKAKKVKDMITSTCATLDVNELIRSEDYIPAETRSLYRNYLVDGMVELPNCPRTRLHEVLEAIMNQISATLRRRVREVPLILSQPVCSELTDGKYRTWLTQMKNLFDVTNISLTVDEDTRELVCVACERLKIYNKALRLAESTQGKYALKFIEKELQLKSPEQKTKYEQEFDELHDRSIIGITPEDLEKPNPRLDKLKDVIVDWRRLHPHMKCVVKCFSMNMISGVQDWMKSTPSLSELKIHTWCGFSHEYSKDRPKEVETVLDKFIAGEIDVLFLTDKYVEITETVKIADLILDYRPRRNELRTRKKSDALHGLPEKEKQLEQILNSLKADKSSFSKEIDRLQREVINK